MRPCARLAGLWINKLDGCRDGDLALWHPSFLHDVYVRCTILGDL